MDSSLTARDWSDRFEHAEDYGIDTSHDEEVAIRHQTRRWKKNRHLQVRMQRRRSRPTSSWNQLPPAASLPLTNAGILRPNQELIFLPNGCVPAGFNFPEDSLHRGINDLNDKFASVLRSFGSDLQAAALPLSDETSEAIDAFYTHMTALLDANQAREWTMENLLDVYNVTSLDRARPPNYFDRRVRLAMAKAFGCKVNIKDETAYLHQDERLDRTQPPGT